jgi:hypothetical protein
MALKKNTDSYYIGKTRTTMRLSNTDKEIVDKSCDKRQITLLVYFEEAVKRNIKYWNSRVKKTKTIPHLSKNDDNISNSTIWLLLEDKQIVDVSCAHRGITLLAYLEEAVKRNIEYWIKKNLQRRKKR